MEMKVERWKQNEYNTKRASEESRERKRKAEILI